MIRLELYQRGLLDLVKKRGVSPEDPYLRCVAESRALVVVREIAVWWRVFQIEAQCRFTSRLLKHLQCFQEVVTSYFNSNRTSPFVEELSRDFLSSLRTHDVLLIRTMAHFEYAFLEVRAGCAGGFEIEWDRHPDLVFQALDNGTELPGPEPECVYRMRIARELPGMVACIREAILLGGSQAHNSRKLAKVDLQPNATDSFIRCVITERTEEQNSCEQN